MKKAPSNGIQRTALRFVLLRKSADLETFRTLAAQEWLLKWKVKMNALKPAAAGSGRFSRRK